MAGTKKAAKRQASAPKAKAVSKRISKAVAKKAPTSRKAPATKTARETARKAAARPKALAKPPARATRGPAKRGEKAATRRHASKGAKESKLPAPVLRAVKVKQLDPLAKCGPATSVEQLFRVDEDTNGHATVHLVFLDRHGWYCVHGPRCAAVADVHLHTRTLQRARAGRR